MAIIDVKKLTKTYKRNIKKEGLSGAVLNLFNPKYEHLTAVNDISFSIDSGELVGYIGANGAGKSTTIKMLTGILTPTSGEITVNGFIPYKQRIKNNFKIGTVFGQRTQLWWDIAPIESYKLLRRMYEIPATVYERNIAFYSEMLDLKDLINVPVRQLSLGQKMRCEIAAAFLHNPLVVYLDEPTIGLDIMVKDKIRYFIKEINREMGTTVILTTHDMQDIEEICQRIMIIDKGSILYDGGIKDIKAKFGKYRIIRFDVKNTTGSFEDLFEKTEDVSVLSTDGNSVEIKFNREKFGPPEVISLVSQRAEILDLTIEEPSIESIVKELFA